MTEKKKVRKKNMWERKRTKADLYTSFDTANVALKTSVKFHKLKREVMGPLFSQLFLSRKGVIHMMGTKSTNQQQKERSSSPTIIEEEVEEDEHDAEEENAPESNQNSPSPSPQPTTSKTRQIKTVKPPVKRKNRDAPTKSKAINTIYRNQTTKTQKSTTKKSRKRQEESEQEEEEENEDNQQEGSDGLDEESD